jgi:hypothetical protein
MQYIDTHLIFNERSSASRSGGAFNPPLFEGSDSSSSEVLGITLRLGNRPLVYDLSKLQRQANKSTPHASGSGTRALMVVHVISALRTQGKAKVEELQYSAVCSDPSDLQTTDLIPETRFNPIFKGSLNISGALDLSGQASLDIPSVVTETLLDEFVGIGDLNLQLCTASEFIGKYTFSLQTPIIQASGIGSNTCSWVIHPNEEKIPLLGDQLLIQMVSVPSSCKTLHYTISGMVKADKGLFWRQQELRTPDYTIELTLPTL